ncbi:GNAT family N-acetyltransferase [Microlunatus soli]|nr:GNAT family N-acetyltransferase [Microlunatus soli]
MTLSEGGYAVAQLPSDSSAVVDAVMALEETGFEVGEQWSRNSWESEFDDPCEVLGAKDASGALIGVIALRYGGDTVDLDRIVVAPSARRRGVGRSLIMTALVQARLRRVTEMILEVRTDNEPAVTLYRELGFTAVTVRSDYYGPGRDAQVMKADTGARKARTNQA